MKQNQQWALVAILVVFTSITRIVLYPFNFSPVIALAFFGGASFQDKKLGLLLPLLAMFVSDAMFELFRVDIGFWGWGQVVDYASLLLIASLGLWVKKPSFMNVTLGAIGSSLIFYFISNTGVWIFDNAYYAKDISGWFDCLMAGLPFLKNGILADLFYCAVFFGGFAYFQKYITAAAKA
jgi:hypothetical protein